MNKQVQGREKQYFLIFFSMSPLSVCLLCRYVFLSAHKAWETQTGTLWCRAPLMRKTLGFDWLFKIWIQLLPPLNEWELHISKWFHFFTFSHLNKAIWIRIFKVSSQAFKRNHCNMITQNGEDSIFVNMKFISSDSDSRNRSKPTKHQQENTCTRRASRLATAPGCNWTSRPPAFWSGRCWTSRSALASTRWSASQTKCPCRPSGFVTEVVAYYPV